MSSTATNEVPSDAESRLPILRRIFQVVLDDSYGPPGTCYEW